MVWKREDFVREVRRQLIELESLRRQIAMGADLSESLARLEASQLCLLRKLAESFDALAAEENRAELAAAAESAAAAADSAATGDTAGAKSSEVEDEEDVVLACADLGLHSGCLHREEPLAVGRSVRGQFPSRRPNDLPPSALN